LSDEEELIELLELLDVEFVGDGTCKLVTLSNASMVDNLDIMNSKVTSSIQGKPVQRFC
jgi:hypothetical protein